MTVLTTSSGRQAGASGWKEGDRGGRCKLVVFFNYLEPNEVLALCGEIPCHNCVSGKFNKSYHNVIRKLARQVNYLFVSNYSASCAAMRLKYAERKGKFRVAPRFPPDVNCKLRTC